MPSPAEGLCGSRSSLVIVTRGPVFWFQCLPHSCCREVFCSFSCGPRACWAGASPSAALLQDSREWTALRLNRDERGSLLTYSAHAGEHPPSAALCGRRLVSRSTVLVAPVGS